MADTNTPNIGLLLPDLNDTFNFSLHVEANFTTIDSLMGAVDCTSTTRPTNTYKGQIIYEHDSLRYVQNTGSKASPTWTYMSHQALSTTSSSRPSSGLTAGEMVYETNNNLLRPYTGSAWGSNITSCTSGSRPANPVTGDLVTETNTSRLIQWNGSSWVQTAFSNWVTTSSTHPGAPFTGLEIYETDTGLSAVYTGSNYSYGVQQLAPTQVLGSTTASVTFSGLPAVNAAKVRWGARGSAAAVGQQIYLQMNGDSATNYHWEVNQANGTTAAATNGTSVAQIQVGTMIAASSTANYWASGEFTIDGLGQTSRFPTVQGTACGFGTATSTNMWSGVYAGIHLATGATTSITLFPAAGSFVSGSQFSIYALQ